MTRDTEIKIKYEKNGTKWSFTAIFDKCSITCGGYKTKKAAMAHFKRLKGNLIKGK